MSHAGAGAANVVLSWTLLVECVPNIVMLEMAEQRQKLSTMRIILE